MFNKPLIMYLCVFNVFIFITSLNIVMSCPGPCKKYCSLIIKYLNVAAAVFGRRETPNNHVRFQYRSLCTVVTFLAPFATANHSKGNERRSFKNQRMGALYVTIPMHKKGWGDMLNGFHYI